LQAEPWLEHPLESRNGDTHLRSADFFDVDAFPEITFESTRVEPIDDKSSRVWGNLAMYGITREVKLDLVLQGTDTVSADWHVLQAGGDVDPGWGDQRDSM